MIVKSDGRNNVEPTNQSTAYTLNRKLFLVRCSFGVRVGTVSSKSMRSFLNFVRCALCAVYKYFSILYLRLNYIYYIILYIKFIRTSWLYLLLLVLLLQRVSPWYSGYPFRLPLKSFAVPVSRWTVWWWPISIMKLTSNLSSPGSEIKKHAH